MSFWSAPPMGNVCWCVCCMSALRSHVPLPLDHFFFCFLPPVAEGACKLLATTVLVRGRYGDHFSHTMLSMWCCAEESPCRSKTKWCRADCVWSPWHRANYRCKRDLNNVTLNHPT
jgi:hypothetical protein